MHYSDYRGLCGRTDDEYNSRQEMRQFHRENPDWKSPLSEPWNEGQWIAAGSFVIAITTVFTGGVALEVFGGSAILGGGVLVAGEGVREQEMGGGPELTLIEEVSEGLASRGIAGAVRLSDAEQQTAGRLQELGYKLTESEHEGAEYIDQLGRSWDQMGTPQASWFWRDGADFLNSVDEHLAKSIDKLVIDMTGFPEDQIEQVREHLSTLDPADLDRIVQIGF